MTIKKVNGGWLVDIQPGGRSGKRISKTLKTKQEALQWESWAKTQSTRNPEWKPEKADLRRLTELMEIWFKTHGQQLRAGENTYSRLKLLCSDLGNPIAGALTASKFAEHRTTQLAKGLKPNSVNRQTAYLKSAINHLKRIGEWRGKNPLEEIRNFKIVEHELSFLSEEQIDQLLGILEKDTEKDCLLVSKLCMSTGLRWAEGAESKIRQYKPCQISVSGKNGKMRSIPIEQSLYEEIIEHHKGKMGDRVFEGCYGKFRVAVSKLDFELPEGQLTHVLRHTFASHFIQKGGNILTLQRVLDHSDLKMTMRYAHLAPDHMQDVLRLNPLA